MIDETDIVSYRQGLQKHLESLEIFLQSPAHTGYKAARQEEIDSTKEAILLNDPFDRPTEIEQFKMRGELRCLEGLLTTFEDARVTLKARIEQALERENQTRTKDTNEV